MAEAMAGLGNLYLTGGPGLCANDELASKWWKRAEEKDPKVTESVSKSPSHAEMKQMCQENGLDVKDEQLGQIEDVFQALMEASVSKNKHKSQDSPFKMDEVLKNSREVFHPKAQRPSTLTMGNQMQETNDRVIRILEAAELNEHLGPEKNEAVCFARALDQFFEFSGLIDYDVPSAMSCLGKAYELDEKACMMDVKMIPVVKSFAQGMISAKDPSTRRSGLWVLSSTSEPIAAIPYLRQLLRETPSARVYEFLTCMFAFLELWKDVRTTAEKGIELHASWYEGHYFLAQAFSRADKEDSEAVLRPDAHYLAAQTHASDLMNGKENKESIKELREHVRKAKEIESYVEKLWGPINCGNKKFIQMLDMANLEKLQQKGHSKKTIKNSSIDMGQKTCVFCSSSESQSNAGSCPCGDVWYCSAKCQGSHWKEHKVACSARKTKAK
mmetsp:Transcript_95011/g.307406  ORF Transcript_95011/g.307406 Transcript_95011/m.307406 type:complete len:442 (+) Transcript_95011:770-2095(+)